MYAVIFYDGLGHAVCQLYRTWEEAHGARIELTRDKCNPSPIARVLNPVAAPAAPHVMSTLEEKCLRRGF